MPSQADLAELVRSNRAIRRLATRDIERLWAQLADLSATDQVEALLEAMPSLVARFGEVAATVAADWYEAQREAAEVARTFAVHLADVADTGSIQASTRWSSGPLFQAEPDRVATLARLVQVLDDKALGQGKRTLVVNAQRDPAKPKVARVPVGKTCAWCRMLGSRGAVYASDASALAGSHARCDCVPVTLWAGSDLPGSYDPDGLYDDYAAAAERAKSGSPKMILAEMRRQGGTG